MPDIFRMKGYEYSVHGPPRLPVLGLPPSAPMPDQTVTVAAAQVQAIQKAIRLRTRGSGWSITNRKERAVLAQQAIRLERATRRLLDALIASGTVCAHDNGVICTPPR